MAGPRRRLLSSLRYMDAMIMVFLACGLAFLSPMIYLWARGDFAWYTPYLIWFAIIAAAAVAGTLRGRGGL